MFYAIPANKRNFTISVLATTRPVCRGMVSDYRIKGMKSKPLILVLASATAAVLSACCAPALTIVEMQEEIAAARANGAITWHECGLEMQRVEYEALREQYAGHPTYIILDHGDEHVEMSMLTDPRCGPVER